MSKFNLDLKFKIQPNKTLEHKNRRINRNLQMPRKSNKRPNPNKRLHNKRLRRSRNRLLVYKKAKAALKPFP